jgi:segregation and condensation protein B
LARFAWCLCPDAIVVRSYAGTTTHAGRKVSARRRRRPSDRARGREHGLSLEDLSAGLASLGHRGADPYAPLAPEATDAAEAAPAAGPALPLAADVTPRAILEAMLFVGQPRNEPLSAARVAGLMRGVRPAEIDQLVEELNEQYRDNGCPYTIVGEAAGYRLALRPEFHPLRERLAGRQREVRLSQAAIEVLALVAYNGAISGEEITRIRGRASGGVLAQLVRRQLLSIERPADRPRQTRYATTGRFLQLFGLESLADLPRSEDIVER